MAMEKLHSFIGDTHIFKWLGFFIVSHVRITSKGVEDFLGIYVGESLLGGIHFGSGWMHLPWLRLGAGCCGRESNTGFFCCVKFDRIVWILLKGESSISPNSSGISGHFFYWNLSMLEVRRWIFFKVFGGL